VRELLFNIVKHAEVDRARVVLQRTNDDLHIEICDDGKGFDAELLNGHEYNSRDEKGAPMQSFGLPTLRHRMILIGGRMEIQSALGAGTRVILTIPVSGNNPASE
jgi:signal transduction histidine kinase